MNVPFLDLKAQYVSIAPEIDDALRRVLDSCAFSGGQFVDRFEEEFAAYCTCRHAIGVGSGTEALWIALLALGVGPGDEIITVTNSFIATAEAISLCGATPVLVDADAENYTMDPSQLEAAITTRTKGIIPVHLYGQPADMDPIMAVARKHGLFVVEDACQAHGAEYKGHRAGSMGDAACFSFYPGKNLGAYGEAGGITTNDEVLASRMRMLRDHGQSRKYHHAMVGANGRMDGFQGAVLSVKLRHLDVWNEKRRTNAARYHSLLSDLEGIAPPLEMEYARHIYHVYALRMRDRGACMQALEAAGIGCGIHYPVPIHLQPAYGFMGVPAGRFPVSEVAAGQLLSLPMYPELTEEQIELVAGKIRRFAQSQDKPNAMASNG